MVYGKQTGSQKSTGIYFFVNIIIIIIARFYSLTNVAMLLSRSDSNSYSLLVGSACLQKQTDVVVRRWFFFTLL